MLTPQGLAEQLNEMEYGSKDSYSLTAKENRLIVLQGYSDDSMTK